MTQWHDCTAGGADGCLVTHLDDHQKHPQLVCLTPSPTPPKKETLMFSTCNALVHRDCQKLLCSQNQDSWLTSNLSRVENIPNLFQLNVVYFSTLYLKALDRQRMPKYDIITYQKPGIKFDYYFQCFGNQLLL